MAVSMTATRTSLPAESSRTGSTFILASAYCEAARLSGAAAFSEAGEDVVRLDAGERRLAGEFADHGGGVAAVGDDPAAQRKSQEIDIDRLRFD